MPADLSITALIMSPPLTLSHPPDKIRSQTTRSTSTNSKTSRNVIPPYVTVLFPSSHASPKSPSRRLNLSPTSR
ncbi:Uncharacterized protein HZ326_22462 [Fusarium oxysporum f. sp. albedinis]|nr:Uncharacterized protein HZ326_22462 [Fusarium oxysporum f. sp. albedinis]